MTKALLTNSSRVCMTFSMSYNRYCESTALFEPRFVGQSTKKAEQSSSKGYGLIHAHALNWNPSCCLYYLEPFKVPATAQKSVTTLKAYCLQCKDKQSNRAWVLYGWKRPPSCFLHNIMCVTTKFKNLWTWNVSFSAKVPSNQPSFLAVLPCLSLSM